jgi:hypothetical protein
MLSNLNNDNLVLWEVYQEGVTWELGSWAQRLVAHFIALAGGLVKDATGAVGEEVEKVRFLRYQA